MAKFYITTTLPYVNADPHIGFALEIVEADVLARYHEAIGDEVFFNTGTDEHGLKIYRRALEEKKDLQAYVDEYAPKFEKLKTTLNLSYTNFIRTTDPHHVNAAQEFWKRCDKNGDIYKKEYRVKYCTGCELEKTDSELVHGRCPIHPKEEIELREEENYFFRFSKYQNSLLDLYASTPDFAVSPLNSNKVRSSFVVPVSRLNEIRSFVARGLEDFSVSRLAAKMPWGVPVPGDPKHVMYVWFDALVSYISTLGWPQDEKRFKEFWPGVQVAGKDNLRQQAAMWQAMLLSAGLPTSRQIFIHGFITHNGEKMSKSVGNVVDPIVLAKKYGTDAVRYFLLNGFYPHDDGDFSEERFEVMYNADLANGLGNFIQRVTTLAEKAKISNSDLSEKQFSLAVEDAKATIRAALNKYEFWDAISAVQNLVSAGDKYVNETKVWELEGNEQRKVLGNLASLSLNIGNLLHIFLPETSEEILRRFGLTLAEVRSSNGGTIAVKKGEPLFKRL
ncbi:MAG: methionine--tRNA ligase [Patescibacteria group bacterium]